MTKIQPAKNKVYLKIEEPKVGVLDTSSRPSAVEVAEVIAVGDNVEGIKKGDILMYKSWGIDIIDWDGKKYHFIDIDTKAICAIIKK